MSCELRREPATGGQLTSSRRINRDCSSGAGACPRSAVCCGAADVEMAPLSTSAAEVRYIRISILRNSWSAGGCAHAASKVMVSFGKWPPAVRCILSGSSCHSAFTLPTHRGTDWRGELLLLGPPGMKLLSTFLSGLSALGLAVRRGLDGRICEAPRGLDGRAAAGGPPRAGLLERAAADAFGVR